MEKAYYNCSECGLELIGKEVAQVALGRNCANGEFAPCPNCKTENSVERDEAE